MAPTTRSKQSSPERGGAARSTTTALAAPSSLDGEKGIRAREGSRTRSEDVFDPNYALDLANRPKENVYLFVPNIIGYIRVITAAGALYIMPTHPKVCTFVYFISCILDVFDGMAARRLGQTSKFGAVLDMVTDRTLVTGATSHKKVTSDVSRILWYYYNDTRILFTVCFANEVCFVCAYLHAFEKTPIHSSVLIKWISQLLPLHSLASALPGPLEVVCNALGGISWATLVFWITIPVCALKQVINVVQFWKASKILVGVDLAERQAAREAEAGIGRTR